MTAFTALSLHSKHHHPPFKQDYFAFQLDFDSTANLINWPNGLEMWIRREKKQKTVPKKTHNTTAAKKNTKAPKFKKTTKLHPCYAEMQNRAPLIEDTQTAKHLFLIIF